VQDSTDTNNGNITSPMNSPFVDWQDPTNVTMPNSNGDYSLEVGSPAIDAGGNTFYPLNANHGEYSEFNGLNLSAEAREAINAALGYDLGGYTRRVDGDGNSEIKIDMGAYEKQ
jgi:hypothetical protein